MQARERKNGRYRNGQGGFACQETLLRGSGSSGVQSYLAAVAVSGSNGEEEGEETINIKHTNETRCMTWQYAMLGVL